MLSRATPVLAPRARYYDLNMAERCPRCKARGFELGPNGGPCPECGWTDPVLGPRIGSNWYSDPANPGMARYCNSHTRAWKGKPKKGQRTWAIPTEPPEQWVVATDPSQRAIASVRDCRVLGGHGLGLSKGAVVEIVFWRAALTRNLGRTRAATQGLRDPATAQDMLGDGKAVALFERGYQIGLGGRGNPAPAGRQPGRRVLGLRADQPRPGPRPQAVAGALPCRRRRPRPAQAGPRRRSRLPARLARRDAPALRLHRCYFASASASASASTPTASRCCATPLPTSYEPAAPASHARRASCRTAGRRRER
jgi:hypothetical protein